VRYGRPRSTSAARRFDETCGLRRAARAVLRLATPLLGAWALGQLCGCQRLDVVTLYGVSPQDAGTGGVGAPDAASSSCTEPDLTTPSIGRTESALSVVDRSLVGSPADYMPDPTLREREGLLDVSQRARREAAWQIAERVLAPAALASGTLPLTAPSLPAWQTWHAKDDITRIFRRAYPDLSAADRAARTPLSESAIAAASSWNDGSVSDFAEWTADRLAAYQGAVDDASKLAGLAGIYRVAYSPAASTHLLQSYGQVLDCMAQSSADALPSAPGAARSTHCGTAPTPPPACLDGVFSSGAALIKAVWLRADAGIPLAVYDTSGPALARRLSSDGPASWDTADGQADPGPDEIYTLRLPNGNAFRLGGLHIMTKELDHWVWMTLWWSADPDSDFGADRPAALEAGPWSHYKLCTSVAFEERDPDPSGGFGSDLPSLGAALSAAYAGFGGPSWCSNPYIENGAGNAATNCVGCHQHAGTGLQTADILADGVHFPEHSRKRVRDDFRSDYVFAVSVGDDLGAMFQETEDYYTAP
jgi:hypothetical protein